MFVSAHKMYSPVERELSDIKTTVSVQNDLIQGLIRQLNEWEVQLQDTRRELTFTLHDNDCLKVRNREFEKRLELAVQTNEQLKHQISDQDDQISLLNRSLNELNHQINRFGVGHVDLVQRENEMRRKMEDMQRSVQVTQDDCKMWKSKFAQVDQQLKDKVAELIEQRNIFKTKLDEKQALIEVNNMELKKLTRELNSCQNLLTKKDEQIASLAKKCNQLADDDSQDKEEIRVSIQEQEKAICLYKIRLSQLETTNQQCKDQIANLERMREKADTAIQDLSETNKLLKLDFNRQLQRKEEELLESKAKILAFEKRFQQSDVQSNSELFYPSKIQFPNLFETENLDERIKKIFESLYQNYEIAVQETEKQKEEMTKMSIEAQSCNLLMYQRKQELDQAYARIQELESQLAEISEEGFPPVTMHSDLIAEAERLKSIVEHLKTEKKELWQRIAELESQSEGKQSPELSESRNLSTPPKSESTAYLREKNAELEQRIDQLKIDIDRQQCEHQNQLESLISEIKQQKQRMDDLREKNAITKTLLKDKESTWEQLTKKLDGSSAECGLLHVKVKKQNERCKALVEKLKKAELQLVEVEKENMDYQILLETLKTNNKVLKESELSLMDERKHLKTEIRQLNDQIVEFKLELSKKTETADIESMKKRYDLECNLRLIENKVGSFETQMTTLKLERDELQRKLDERELKDKKISDQSKHKVQSLTSEKRFLDSEIVNLKQDNEDLQQKLTSISKTTEGVIIDKLNRENSLLKKRIETLEEQLRLKKEELQALAKERDDLSAAISEKENLRRMANHLNIKISRVEKQKDDISKEMAETRSKLAKAEQSLSEHEMRFKTLRAHNEGRINRLDEQLKKANQFLLARDNKIKLLESKLNNRAQAAPSDTKRLTAKRVAPENKTTLIAPESKTATLAPVTVSTQETSSTTTGNETATVPSILITSPDPGQQSPLPRSICAALSSTQSAEKRKHSELSEDSPVEVRVEKKVKTDDHPEQQVENIPELSIESIPSSGSSSASNVPSTLTTTTDTPAQSDAPPNPSRPLHPRRLIKRPGTNASALARQNQRADEGEADSKSPVRRLNRK